ncbi:MAG: hypothetical protein QOF88_6333 [Mycobacterium sp.]|nr:hypothetical protein [Mycobacterium sp.]
MHVIAFAPSLKAVLEDAGEVTTDGFPMTSAHVTSFPAQIAVPLVLAVYTQGAPTTTRASTSSPNHHVVNDSPPSNAPGTGRTTRLARQGPRLRPPPGDGGAIRAGVYTVGLYDSPDATENDHSFPLPVVQGQPVRAASETTLGTRVIERFIGGCAAESSNLGHRD